MDETALRQLLDSALDGEPPLGPIAQNSLRTGIKLRRRRRVRAAAGSAAAAAAIAVAIPAGIGALGHSPGPAARHQSAARTVYVPYLPDFVKPGTLSTVIPISTATNTPGTPIRIRGPVGDVAITPNGKTLYVAVGQNKVIPISTATGTAGQADPPRRRPRTLRRRGHPGREDRLRRRPLGYGRPDQHRHQHARQAHPHPSPIWLPRSDHVHPEREDRLRRPPSPQRL